MNQKLRIGIIGHGFVGKATEYGFKGKNDIILIDPKLGTTVKQLNGFKPEFIFICVPTPMSNENSQDCSIINEVISELNSLDIDFTVLLKSTILPNNLLEIKRKLDKPIVYNPEFLREKTALSDFINSDMYIL